MEKPKNFELKKWLCSTTITGIIVHYVQTGNETAETRWELITFDGEKKTVNAGLARTLLDVDHKHWCQIASVKKGIRESIEKWERFVSEEAADFAEYQRLQKKFGAI